MKAIVADTETNGKPLNYRASMREVEAWPRITQIAWKVIHVEEELELIEFQSLIYPDGWTIPEEPFFIENNMSTERCIQEGKPIEYVLNRFVEDVSDVDLLVCHNVNFDRNVIGAEMIRAGISTNKRLTPICTMELSTEYCAIEKVSYKGFKWPSLQELHTKILGEGFEDGHDAMIDVSATARCFLELVKRKIIIL